MDEPTHLANRRDHLRRDVKESDPVSGFLFWEYLMSILIREKHLFQTSYRRSKKLGRAPHVLVPRCRSGAPQEHADSGCAKKMLKLVGPPGIEPGLHAPHACVLPVYYGPK